MHEDQQTTAACCTIPDITKELHAQCTTKPAVDNKGDIEGLKPPFLYFSIIMRCIPTSNRAGNPNKNNNKQTNKMKCTTGADASVEALKLYDMKLLTLAYLSLLSSAC